MVGGINDAAVGIKVMISVHLYFPPLILLFFSSHAFLFCYLSLARIALQDVFLFIRTAFVICSAILNTAEKTFVVQRLEKLCVNVLVLLTVM